VLNLDNFKNFELDNGARFKPQQASLWHNGMPIAPQPPLKQY
jgi:hypothetical protein